MNPIVSNGNKLKWKFGNVKKLTCDGIWSNKFIFEGIAWKIHVYTKTENTTKYLGVCLNYVGDNKTEKNWICEAKKAYKVLNQNENGKDCTKEGVSFYDAKLHSWGYPKFIEWSKLESDGYMKDESIIVEIELDFKYYDFSTNNSNYTDIIINVQDTKFYAIKELLSSKSKYFHNKFIVDKSVEKELTIENVKAEDFLYFIASFCSFFEKVKDDNYEQLMKLADKYKTPRLHKSCEKFLISHENLEVDKKIEYAAEYSYDELLKECIDSLTTIDQIDKLHECVGFKNLKNTTKLAIGKKMVDILNKLERNEEEFECQSCTMDIKENLRICQTCNAQNLKHFNSEKAVLEIAICSNCAITKHIQRKHVVIDFLPHYLAYNFKNHSGEIGIIMTRFQQAENFRRNKEQIWKTMNEKAETKFNELTDLTRRSKSTKYLQQNVNVNVIKGFIESAKNVNDRLIEVMKTKEVLLQKNLQELEKWIEEKSKECVKDEETIRLDIQ